MHENLKNKSAKPVCKNPSSYFSAHLSWTTKLAYSAAGAHGWMTGVISEHSCGQVMTDG